MIARTVLCAMGTLVALAGCGERAQTVPVGTAKKSDGQLWQIHDNGYLASGWTPGNEASWDAQLVKRTQGQNDYAPRQ
ncbi:MAG: hypothetical protein M3Z29_16805 [Pseudomonadota bacterium]|nr:hypothetical protein [Pseudomonadota bacterium]